MLTALIASLSVGLFIGLSLGKGFRRTFVFVVDVAIALALLPAVAVAELVTLRADCPRLDAFCDKYASCCRESLRRYAA